MFLKDLFLKGSTAVLVGAGKVNSVGAATAKCLAKEGCDLLIHCHQSIDQAKQVVATCKQFDVNVELLIGDATKSSVCNEMAQFVDDKWGKTDILVNCLGLTKSAPYEKLDLLNEEDLAKLFAVNVTAPYLMAQAFQYLLKKSGDASLINVSSAAGITGKGSSIGYAAAKGGENTLTLALAQALSPEVRVNAICPSFIDSSWWEASYEGKEDKYQALLNNMRSNNLLNRVLTPKDVAETILSVIKNPVMTGELIRLDAGMHIGKANVREFNTNPSSKF